MTKTWKAAPHLALGAVLVVLLGGAPAWGGAAARTSGREDAYVVVDGDTVLMSGDMRDLAEARAQSRARGGAELLWFRHGGRAYVTRDPATVAELRRLHLPQRALSREQQALSREQAELSARQVALSRRQDDLEHELDELSDHADGGAEHAAADVKRAELSARLAALSPDQEELSRLEKDLDSKEEALSRREDELSRNIDREVQNLLADAVLRGIAEVVRH